jgi:hypothetical protein
LLFKRSSINRLNALNYSNVPVGVLYDLFGEGRREMHITVHFQAFPSQTILKCVSPVDSEQFYFHSLKQALYVLHGKTKPFNDLSVEQQRALWQAVRDSHREAFEEISATFRLSAPLLANMAAVKDVKGIPIRVLRRDKPTTQRPVSLWKPPAAVVLAGLEKMDTIETATAAATVAAAVDVAATSTTEPTKPTKATEYSAPAATETATGGKGDNSSEPAAPAAALHEAPLVMKTLEDVLQQDFNAALGLGENSCRSLNVVIQGVAVPWDSPIYELWRLMAHCDLFLYIVVL